MKVFIVYCHPSSNSFTYTVKEAFLKGILEAGHSYVISDLYAMGFHAAFSESEYLREAFYDDAQNVPSDILLEQEKINSSDAIVFIYPDFWTEAPALLTGWFQRVLTYGFAYGDNRKMKTLDKALFLVTMGGSLKDEIRKQQLKAMKTVMLGDRMYQRAKSNEMIVFDEMTRGYGNEGCRNENIINFAGQAYELGKKIGYPKMTISVFYEHILEAHEQSGLPVAELLHTLHLAGIDAVECSLDHLKDSPQSLVHLLEEEGLTLSSIHGNCDFASSEEETGFDLIDTAQMLNVNTVLVVPGFLPDLKEETRQSVLSKMVFCLNRLCSYAAQKHITVTLEDFDGLYAPYSTPEELLWFLEQVPQLRITFDTGNFAFLNKDELTAFEALKSSVVHVHCKDRSLLVNDGDPLTAEDGRRLYPCSVGSGCIQTAELLRRLKEQKYRGSLSIEHFGSKHQLDDMKQSAVWLVNQLRLDL